MNGSTESKVLGIAPNLQTSFMDDVSLNPQYKNSTGDLIQNPILPIEDKGVIDIKVQKKSIN